MSENLLDTCNVCSEFNVSGCASEIIFGLGVGNASDTIYYTLTDKFGKEYLGTLTTDAVGFGALDYTDFPDNFFNPYAGTMTIEFFTTAYRTTNITANCTCVSMTMIESSETGSQYLVC